MERISGKVHDIQVVNRGSIRYMRFGSRGGWQGALDSNQPSRPVFPYQRAFAASLPVSGSHHTQKFLSFGVGTGTSLRSVQAAFPDAKLFGVELDQQVIDTAIRYFDAPGYDTVQYFVGDGLDYLNKTSEKFSLLFVDAYMSNSIYSPCLEPTVPKLLHQALEPDGVAWFNLIMQLPPTQHVATWLREAESYFSSIYLLPVGMPFFEQNVLAVASVQSLPIQVLRQALRNSEFLSAWERVTWPFRVIAI